MKKLIAITIVLLLLFAVTCYIFYVPPRNTGYLGVTYSWSQTNAGGGVVYILSISNGGPYLVHTSAGTETRNGQFASYNMSGLETLKPGEKKTISVTLPPSASPPARITAFFQKVYSPGWRDRARLYIDAYLFKRAVFERTYPVDH